MEKAREIAHQISLTDELTQAYSRRLFFELAAEELTRAKRYQRPFAIILLDIDHLAQINQTYGHLGGDHVLRFCSEACQSNLRVQDIFARYGGEEFVLVLPETDLEGTLTMAERIRRQIETHVFVWESQIIQVTISLGVAILKRALHHLRNSFA
ncbi:MAG: GGDEF domain-containing protein [Acaryochloridaceae cyanobacterium CSU_5_19]|nr:GGDEF domain-containing protein [Acaryochloridaceae cyanobacterium CSU_5_19]